MQEHESLKLEGEANFIFSNAAFINGTCVREHNGEFGHKENEKPELRQIKRNWKITRKPGSQEQLPGIQKRNRVIISHMTFQVIVIF